MKNIFTYLILICAGLLEVGGDALIRKGMRGSGFVSIAGGMLILSIYGLVVNTVKWDFSKLLGVYISVFAILSILFGRYFFNESISSVTWIVMTIIVIGGLVIQFSQV